MKIECTEVSKAYIKESINVALMRKRLMRKPERRIRDHFLIIPVWCIASALILVALIQISLTDNSALYGVMIGCLLILEFFMLAKYISMVKLYRKAIKKDRHLEFDFTTDGIEYDNHENRKVSSTWDSFQCLKICKTGMFLIPKDETGFLYGFQIENRDEIEKFFLENEIDISFCDPWGRG